MLVVSKIQPSFSSGELSPSLYPRVDLNRYPTGLKKCKNFIIHPHGGASNRPGTKLAAQTKTTTKSRVVKFVFSDTQSYVLEFGVEYIRFYKDHAQILSGTAYEVATPYAEADLFELKFERSADVLYILHPDYQTRTLSRYADDDWRLELYTSDDGPFMPENLVETTTIAVAATTGTAVAMTANAAVFDNPDHIGALWKLTHYVPGQVATSAFTGTGSGAAISCFTTWRLITHGTWTGKIRIEKSEDSGATWTTLREFSGADDFNANTYGTEDVETNPDPFQVRVTCYAFTSGTINVDLSTDPFFQSGVARITAVASSMTATVSIITPMASTVAVATWAEGAWSIYRGYPSVGVFHQDRLCLAASNDEPMNEWMSQVGNYTSFKVNSTVLDTDAINIKLLSRQLNTINNLIALGDMLALTSASEWKVGADKSVLTPATVFTRVQGYRGSSSVTPVTIGNQIIYVQANGTVVRNLGYDYASDSYVGTDLRILSDHLFTNYDIIEMDYQQDNDSLVWLVRSDGILLCLTYMQEQDVIAWSWHETDGLVESVCVIPQDGYDELWMIVNRDGTRFVEYMVPRMTSSDIQDQYFVDCGITYDNPITDMVGATRADPCVITTTANHGLSDGDLVDITDIVGMTELNGNRYKVANKTDKTFELTDEDDVNIDSTLFTTYVSGGYIRKCYTTFSGLDHLAGKTVAILGNGEVLPQQVVGTGDTYTKLLMHMNGENGAVSITDDAGKTVTNPSVYDAYTKLDSRFDGVDEAVAYTDPIAGAYTFGGTAQLDTAYKKFGTSALLLDGNSDYLTLPDSADWDFGTSDFTIDFWVRFTSISAGVIVCHGSLGSVVDTSGWMLAYGLTVGNMRWLYRNAASGIVDNFNFSWTPLVDTWYHVALVNSSTSLKMYVNGTQVDTAKTATANINEGTEKLTVGSLYDFGGYFFNGHIDELRISKGVARWTADFSASLPSGPYGQVYTSTGVKQLGTASSYFNGVGLYLTVADSADFSFADGDFTIDTWINFNAIGKVQYICGQYEDATNYWFAAIDASNKLHIKFFDGTAKGEYVMTSAWSGLATGAWHHVAFVRSTISAKIFINGVSQTLTETTTFSTNNVGDIVGDLYIGQQNSLGYFDGYMDELRISKGIARWTANFDVPIIAYTIDASGEITLATPCSRLSVGLPYTADFETLNVEIPMRDGTLQGRQVKISNVTFRVLNTRGGWIGPNFDTLYEAFTDEDLGLTAPGLASTDVWVPLGAGYEDGGRICYRQVDPLPVTIGAVVPEVTV